MWCNLPQISTHHLGKTLNREDDTGEELAYLCSVNIYWEGVDLSILKTAKFTKEEVSKYCVEKGDLLICEGGDVGRSAIWNYDTPMLFQNALHRVRFEKGLEVKYFYYLFLYLKLIGHIDFICKGVTIKHLTNSVIDTIAIPLPPLKEQNRIVNQVENWMSIIDVLESDEKNIHESISIAKSKILDLAIHGKLVPQVPSDEPASELLKRINPKAIISRDNPHYENSQLPDGWLELPISEFCDSINGLWTGKKPPFVNVGVIRNANFTKDFRLDYSKIEYIDVESKAFAKRHLIDGDLIVEKSGGSDNNPVGRSILYEGPDVTYSYSNFTMVLRIQNRELVLSKYLYYFLMAIYIRGDMRKMQTQTTGLHNLILDSFMSIMVPIPPLQEQIRIVEKIQKTFHMLDFIGESLS